MNILMKLIGLACKLGRWRWWSGATLTVDDGIPCR